MQESKIMGSRREGSSWVLAYADIYKDVQFSFQKGRFSLLYLYSCFQFKWNGHLLKIDTDKLSIIVVKKFMKGKLMNSSCSVSSFSVTLHLAGECLSLVLPDLQKMHIIALKDTVILKTEIQLMIFSVIYQASYDYELIKREYIASLQY